MRQQNLAMPDEDGRLVALEMVMKKRIKQKIVEQGKTMSRTGMPEQYIQPQLNLATVMDTNAQT